MRDLVTGAEVLAAPQAGPAGAMPGTRMLDRLVRADNEGHGRDRSLSGRSRNGVVHRRQWHGRTVLSCAT